MLLPTLPPADLWTWLDGVERDVLHTLACRWYVPWLDRVFVAVQSGALAAGLILVCAVVLALRSRPRAFRVLLSGSAAFGLAMGIATLLWPLVDRPRPPAAYEELLRTPEELAACERRPEALPCRMGPVWSPSFPSRHGLSIGVFVTTLFLASRWLGLVALVYGLVAAVGRVYVARHWPTDVLAGILIGVVLALLCWRWVPRILARMGRAAWVEDPPGTTGDARGYNDAVAQAGSDP